MTTALSLAGAIAAPVALACGEWVLVDHERETEVLHQVVSGPGYRVIGRDPARLQVWNDGRMLGFFRDCDLIWERRRVGELTPDGTLTIRDTTYRIDIQERPDEIYRWHVEVRRGDDVVASGDALSFCMCSGCTDSHHRTDVLRRVSFYLAARQLTPGVLAP